MENQGLTFTIEEFCQQVRISRKAFYDLKNRGEGPKLIRLGRRVYIAQDTARRWLQEREAASQEYSFAMTGESAGRTTQRG